ncbi:MAG: leucine-rich repeat domain-containing protein [Oscillospiraceae bacterium]|nr:leucine-rich repeat domain-containing protein [Oscillospiraceae bacterium]
MHTYVTIQGEDYDIETTFSLNLYGCDITDEDVVNIGRLKNFRELYLSSNSIDDITPLSGLTNLTNLNLGHSDRISDLTPLEGLINLTDFDLAFTKIDDIKPLAKLNNLTMVVLRGCGIGETDSEWLKAQLPDCNIIL